ncbi:MAG: hypothetical protein NNA31_10505 [Nitrospira sp.]|nr:hypothetical protein [Nitrospira sp.]
MSRKNLLFYEHDLDRILCAHLAGIGAKVDAIPQDQFMNARPEDVVAHLVSQMTVNPLVLYEDRAEMEQKETKIDVAAWRDRKPFGDPGPIYVAGVAITVTIPFTGDGQLWTCRPNQRQTVFPRGRVSPARGDGVGQLYIDMAQPADEPPDRFKSRLDDELKSIRFYIDAQRKQIEQFNAGLPAAIRPAVDARRARIQKHQGLKDVLGIPLKRREGAPFVEPIKLTRKLVRPLPPPPKSGYQPEPGIADEDYAHILSVIRHEGRTFETTPKTYAVHDEEELRDILLAHLNGHYQGDASAETFRRGGKTDIRIEDNNRAAFVAECKVWKGPKELSQAIDQLLGYLTWRDCKAALVIFNKHNAKFSAIVEGVPSIFKSHEKFRGLLLSGSGGEWQFRMSSREDEGRDVRVHVFVFNLYAG